MGVPSYWFGDPGRPSKSENYWNPKKSEKITIFFNIIFFPLNLKFSLTNGQNPMNYGQSWLNKQKTNQFDYNAIYAIFAIFSSLI